jgi:hypothetical protein
MGYCIIDLTSLERFERRSTAVFPAASTIKLAVLYELMKRAGEGALSLDDMVKLDRKRAVGGSGVKVAICCGATNGPPAVNTMPNSKKLKIKPAFQFMCMETPLQKKICEDDTPKGRVRATPQAVDAAPPAKVPTDCCRLSPHTTDFLIQCLPKNAHPSTQIRL